MKRRKRFVPFKRKFEGKTDYRKRLALLKSGKPRLVVRKTLNNCYVQVVQYGHEGDIVLAAAGSEELKKLGWTLHRGNIPAAYLTGLLCGEKAKKKGVKEAIFDTGLHTTVKGSVIFAALKGAVDAGLSIQHTDDILPPEDRLKGKHIKGKDVEKEFEAVKRKIIGGSK